MYWITDVFGAHLPNEKQAACDTEDLSGRHSTPTAAVNPQFSCHVTKTQNDPSYFQIRMTPSV